MEALTLSWIAGVCGALYDGPDVLITSVCTDSRRVDAGELFIPLIGESFDGHDFIESAAKSGAAAALSSKDISASIPVIMVEDTLKALHEIAAAYRRLMPARVVALTGSVGKTTTKEMLASILSRRYNTLKTEGNLNNEIGLPLTALELESSNEIAVFELGMNHFGEMSRLTAIAQPDTALINNIGTAHIGNLGSREGILKAKLEILEGLKSGGRIIFNGDEPLLWSLRDRYDAVYFGINNASCRFRAENLRTTEVGMRISTTTPAGSFDSSTPNGTNFTLITPDESFDVFVPAVGEHNVMNALAAATAAYLNGCSAEDIRDGLNYFRNTGMRQKIYGFSGITIIEDCYNAGPESMAAALSVLKGVKANRRIAVLGGMLELGESSKTEHINLGGRAVKSCDLLYLYGGDSAFTMEGALLSGMPAENIRLFSSREKLAEALRAEAKTGDAILFKGSRGMKLEQALKLFTSPE